MPLIQYYVCALADVDERNGSAYLAQVMMSSSLGYITVKRGNSNEKNSGNLKAYVNVPNKTSVMVSFKQLERSRPYVKLYKLDYDVLEYNGRLVWGDISYLKKFYFAKIIKARKLRVLISKSDSFKVCGFQIFFSFLPEWKLPQSLSSSLWNCSVDYYPSFQHHVECNLKTECEGGQDETEHCPISSADCQGLIAFCDRCYKLVGGLRAYDSNQTDANRRADEYCSSHGGRLGIPQCIPDWCSRLLIASHVHLSVLEQAMVGLYYRGIRWNRMYVHSFICKNTVVFHHSISSEYHRIHSDEKQCLTVLTCQTSTLIQCFLDSEILPTSDTSICEIKMNKTENHVHHLQSITLSSTQLTSFKRQGSMAACSDGHVTFAFFLYGSSLHSEHSCCHLPHPQSHTDWFSLAGLHPTFACDDQFSTIAFSLVCDFLSDCQDNSDESFCDYLPCASTFTCPDHQCVSYGKVCNLMPHCSDQSDEQNCKKFKTLHLKTRFISSSVLTDFDGVSQFVSSLMNPNDSCPDSHYRCPGDYDDCLPVYTRCKGMHDCIDLQDEERCEEITCPGLFRCRASKICVHSDHLCDGWSYCPQRDDELLCDMTCPIGCQCQGHSFLCSQPFSAAQSPGVRYLNGTGSGMTLSDMNGNAYLIHLVLAQCLLTILPSIELLNLRVLDLSGNRLQLVNISTFLGLKNLQTLSLSNNPLTQLHTDLSSVTMHSALTQIDLSFTKLTLLDTTVFSQFPGVQKLNLTSTSIHTISPAGFLYTPALSELYLDNSPVDEFPSDVFRDLVQLSVIHTDNYKLCCSEIVPHYLDESSCHVPKDEISSCEDLLQSLAYRGFLWLITCLSLTGNVFCFCARLISRSMTSSSGFSVFVLNLTMADFLMGVYIAMIGVADEQYRGRYLHYDDTWKSSVTCKVAGFLSLLSSEVSALVIFLITLDRFIVLRFPFSTLRFERTSATLTCLVSWLAGWFLAAIPLLPVTAYWEFYGQTDICIPLPVTRRDFIGRLYSFSVMIVFNFVLFLLISFGQIFVYWSIQSNALQTNTTKVSRDMTIARRLISVAVSDFLCWFPIGLCGMLALTDTPIPGEVNVALAIFILPLNSAINPFMYTFNTWAEKRRKSYEANLIKWLETNPDTLHSSEHM